MVARDAILGALADVARGKDEKKGAVASSSSSKIATREAIDSAVLNSLAGGGLLTGAGKDGKKGSMLDDLNI